MSLAVGIDVGAYKCAVAVCRAGEREAQRKALTIATNRSGFTNLDAWMAQQGAPIDVVVMELRSSANPITQFGVFDQVSE